jgi:hypothetical protein
MSDLKKRIREASREADRRYLDQDEVILITANKGELEDLNPHKAVGMKFPLASRGGEIFRIYGRFFEIVTPLSGSATDGIANRDTRYSEELPPVDELEPIMPVFPEFTVQWQDIMTTAADIEPTDEDFESVTRPGFEMEPSFMAHRTYKGKRVKIEISYLDGSPVRLCDGYDIIKHFNGEMG